MDWAQGRPYVAVVVVVRPEDGRILIVRRSPQSSNPGEWEVPGGHIDPGETAVEAAEREVREETGLACRVWNPEAGGWTFFDLRDKPGKWGVIFGATLLGGTFKLKADEHDDFMWVTPDELRRLAEEVEPYLTNVAGAFLEPEAPPWHAGPREMPCFRMPPWMVENVAHVAGIALGREDVPRTRTTDWEAFWPPGRLRTDLAVGSLIKGWLVAVKAQIQR